MASFVVTEEPSGPPPPIPSAPCVEPPPVPSSPPVGTEGEDTKGISHSTLLYSVDESSLAYMKQRFLHSFELMGIGDVEEVGEALEREFLMIANYYSEPQRHYHTLQHIEDCLKHFDIFAAWCDAAPPGETSAERNCSVRDRSILLLAIFYHDIIYDPKSSCNEELSAEVGRRVLLRIQQLCSRSSKSLLATDAIKSVVALVLATKHMSEKAETSQDIAALTAVMLDIDLSVLGRVREEYEGYEKDIRSEYIHVPLEGYCAGRTKILEMFLGQARARQLFHSECFSCMVQPNGLSWHENAEINMTWAIEELASQMREAEMQESPSEYPIGETLASAQEELGEEESENLTALRDMLTSHP